MAVLDVSRAGVGFQQIYKAIGELGLSLDITVVESPQTVGFPMERTITVPVRSKDRLEGLIGASLSEDVRGHMYALFNDEVREITYVKYGRQAF